MAPLNRYDRQRLVGAWVKKCFGEDILNNGRERVARLLEEALELAQAEGLGVEAAYRLVTHVYARPVGDPMQEVGGVSITLLAYSASKGFCAESLEQQEFNRIMAKTPEHFRARQQAKVDAGVAAEMSCEV